MAISYKRVFFNYAVTNLNFWQAKLKKRQKRNLCNTGHTPSAKGGHVVGSKAPEQLLYML